MFKSLFKKISAIFVRKRPVFVEINPNKFDIRITNNKELQRLISFPQIGTFEIHPWYADNKKYCQELRLCLSLPDWYEFENQPFFRELIQYLHNKEIQGNISPPL